MIPDKITKPNNDQNKNLIQWLLVVLVLTVLLRIALYLFYPVQSYPDTAAYKRLANSVRNSFRLYDGTRGPGYPVFLALFKSDQLAYAVQLVLGCLITMIWFLIGWKAFSRPWLGALTALAYSLNPNQFFFETNLLSETLSTFFLTTGFFGVWLWISEERWRRFWLGLAIGVVISLAALTRPLFQYMPVLLVIFLGITIKNKKIKFHWKAIISITLISALIIGGWSYWIYTRFHVFGTTNIMGYHLVQHAGYFFEDIPDRHAQIRDIYIQFRDARIAEYGSQGNTIWAAIPAIMEATGYSFYELSRIIQSISIQLILNHPFEFFTLVIHDWWYFWRVPIHFAPEIFTSGSLLNVLNATLLGIRMVLFGANLVFITTSVAAIISKKLRDLWSISAFHWILASSVWGASVISSILEHGTNPRFLVPLQVPAVFWSIWVGWKTWRVWIAQRKERE